MSTSAVRDRLRHAQFLEGLTDSALHQLAKLVTPETYECDQVLFEEGSARTFLAIIVSGASSSNSSSWMVPWFVSMVALEGICNLAEMGGRNEVAG